MTLGADSRDGVRTFLLHGVGFLWARRTALARAPRPARSDPELPGETAEAVSGRLAARSGRDAERSQACPEITRPVPRPCGMNVRTDAKPEADRVISGGGLQFPVPARPTAASAFSGAVSLRRFAGGRRWERGRARERFQARWDEAFLAFLV